MKNYAKKSLKASNGITLIALVITIIVLLILAGISISMLAGDNSILQKATDAKQTSERAEAKEQAQMDIMAYISDKTANHQDVSLDDTKIKDILTEKSYVKEAGDTSFTTKKGEYIIPYSELYVATETTPTIPDDSTQTGINYGDKTAETIAVGDDVTIGTTEKFKVIKKSSDGKTITLIPYYNLKLDETTIKQATEETAESAGTVSFSSIDTPTWSASNNIDLSVHVNNVKSYIDSYQTTLRSFGIDNVTAKIGTYYGANTSSDYVEDLSNLLNPSGKGDFWIGASEEYSAEYVLAWQAEYGFIVDIDYKNSSDIGVRPVVILNIN